MNIFIISKNSSYFSFITRGIFNEEFIGIPPWRKNISDNGTDSVLRKTMYKENTTVVQKTPLHKECGQKQGKKSSQRKTIAVFLSQKDSVRNPLHISHHKTRETREREKQLECFSSNHRRITKIDSDGIGTIKIKYFVGVRVIL